jgi:4-carboxymuconolactone decarboxylase
MKPEQRAVYAQTMGGRRGSVPANVLVWLQSPNLAARAQKLGEFVRYDTVLPARLSELAILVVARHWS